MVSGRGDFRNDLSRQGWLVSLDLQVLEVSLAALLREGKTETGGGTKDTEHC